MQRIIYIGKISRHVYIRGGYWGPSSYCRGTTKTGQCELCTALARKR